MSGLLRGKRISGVPFLSSRKCKAKEAPLGQFIVPVIGARKGTQLAESLGALRLQLSPAEVARIESAIPAAEVAGTWYDERQMQVLDSER